MVNPDRAVPDWVNKWLMINSAILIFDGSFCVLRPHSLPGGCLGSTVFYAYRWYIQADKHYADATDSFIWAQGFGNLIEATVCTLILLNIFKPVRLSKMVTIIVSVMTCYKTIIFSLYALDIGQGGHAFGGWIAELTVFGLGSIWLLVPAKVVYVLMQDFVDINKPKKVAGSSSRDTNSKQSADDTNSKQSADDTNSKQSADDTIDGNLSVSDTPTRNRYNLRNR